MTPKQWAEWFRKKHPKESIQDLSEALRSASKYGLWHHPHYAEDVIKELKQLK